MQLSRLVEAVTILKSEFERLGLMNLITEAANLSAQRPNLPIDHYVARASRIRYSAMRAIEEDQLQNASAEILDPIKNGRLSALLPSRIGRLILASIPERNPQDAAASPEILLYRSQANLVMSQVVGFLSTTDAFGVEHYAPQVGNVALELSLPRMLFENELEHLGEKISSFDRLMRCLSELFTGSRTPPKILYITTSDQIFIIEWLPAAAVPFICYYRELLDVASSAINVMKMVRDLTGSGASPEMAETVKDQLSGVVDKKTKALIEATVKQYAPAVTPGRANELISEIEIHTKVVVKDIAGGARISINIDSGLHNLATTDDSSEQQRPDGFDLEKLTNIAKETISLGDKLGTIFDAMTENRGRIEDKSSSDAIDV